MGMETPPQASRQRSRRGGSGGGRWFRLRSPQAPSCGGPLPWPCRRPPVGSSLCRFASAAAANPSAPKVAAGRAHPRGCGGAGRGCQLFRVPHPRLAPRSGQRGLASWWIGCHPRERPPSTTASLHRGVLLFRSCLAATSPPPCRVPQYQPHREPPPGDTSGRASLPRRPAASHRADRFGSPLKRNAPSRKRDCAPKSSGGELTQARIVSACRRWRSMAGRAARVGEAGRHCPALPWGRLPLPRCRRSAVVLATGSAAYERRRQYPAINLPLPMRRSRPCGAGQERSAAPTSRGWRGTRKEPCGSRSAQAARMMNAVLLLRAHPALPEDRSLGLAVGLDGWEKKKATSRQRGAGLRSASRLHPQFFAAGGEAVG